MRDRCAVIEVDDLRHMLVQPHVAPWDGAEGRRQQRLGVTNAALLAAAFAEDGADVVIADVVTTDTAALYRQAMVRGPLTVVHLTIAPGLAHERATGRHYSLTDEQFFALHTAQEQFREFDYQLDTSATSVPDAAASISSMLDKSA